MPVDLSGDWQHVSSEGVEEYLRSIGVGDDRIQQAMAAKPNLVIKQTGDNNFTVTSGFLKETHTYAIGTPFTGKVGENEVTSVASWDGNKLVLTTTSELPKHAGKQHITTREIVGGQLVQTTYISGGGPVGKRTFKK